MADARRTVAVDFDGVIHPYTDGWTGPVPADELPRQGVRAFLAGLVDQGYRVVVHTTRADNPEGGYATVLWLRKHDLARFVDDVTATKPRAIAYVDDRAVPFVGDWDEVMDTIDDLDKFGTTVGRKPERKDGP